MKNNGHFDLVIKGGRVIDAAQGIDGIMDVGVSAGKIAAVAEQLPEDKADQVVDAHRHIVSPGLIDLHVHVYEWLTNFGLPPDDAGLHSGATTVVDQGSCGAWTFEGFRAYVAEPSITDIRCFLSINVAGAMRGGLNGPELHSPEMVDVDALVATARKNPAIVRGIKCHGESGAISRWGIEVLKRAREAADRSGLPLYVHTGELFPVDEANRPTPNTVLGQVLKLLRPGDIVAHCYSNKPDGVMGLRERVPKELHDAVDRGILLDLGHGVNFSLDIARRMMGEGIYPFTISSDVHGDFDSMHNDTLLDYSLCGALSKLVALGMELEAALAAVTVNPARILGCEDEIGSLCAGSSADLTVLGEIKGDWRFSDAADQQLSADMRYVPTGVIRAGRLVKPEGRLLRDLGGSAAIAQAA
ncbi:MAG: amidohydrolase/deacetylase family metallohydrolase [Hyphomicrobiales bacterium]|nr:amidohydrolase/deacetylase family metallohydrolase [Hyphomicrobiales bacterium]